MSQLAARAFPGAASLSGNSRIDFGSNAVWAALGPAGAISMWVKLTKHANGRFLCIGMSGSHIALGEGGWFSANSGDIYIAAHTNLAAYNGADIKVPGALNSWHHVLITWDSTDVVAYVDGVAGASIVGNYSHTWATGTVQVGDLFSAGAYQNCDATDLRIYGAKVTAAQAAALYQRDIDPSAVVSRWNFSDGIGTTVTLSGGTGNNGTITASQWTTVLPAHTRPRARTFPGAVVTAGGTTSRVDFGSHSSYNAASGSVAFWASLAPGGTAVSQEIFCLGTGASDVIEFYADVGGANPGRLKVNVIRASSGGPIATTNVGWVEYNRWHHYVIAWSASGFEIVVDGIRVYKSAADCHMAFGSNPSLMLGNYAPSSSFAFPGAYTDLRLYSAAMSTAQALSLYTDNVDPAPPVARWDFHDGSGSTVSLLSGTGNNGAATGGSWTSSVPMAGRPSATGQGLIPQSQAFTTSPWAVVRATVTLTGGQSDPVGGSNAFLMTETATTDTHWIDQTISFAPNRWFLMSVFAKAGSGGGRVGLIMAGSGQALWDTSAAMAALGFTGTGTMTPIMQWTKDVGGGWYRLFVMFSTTSSTGNLYGPAMGAGASLQTVTAGSTGNSVYMFGAQCEQVASGTRYLNASTVHGMFPYQATTASPVDGGVRRDFTSPQNALPKTDVYSTAAWTATGLTSRTDLQTDPDGLTKATKLLEDTSGAGHAITSAGFTPTANGFARVSAWVKDVDRGYAGVGTNTSSQSAIFNIATGAVAVGPGGNTVATFASPNTVSGWRRVSVVFAVTAGTTFVPAIWVSDGISSSYFYTGTSKSILVSKAQMEIFYGSVQPPGAPGGYVETTGTAVNTAGVRLAIM